jgi:hypothetical protein
MQRISLHSRSIPLVICLLYKPPYTVNNRSVVFASTIGFAVTGITLSVKPSPTAAPCVPFADASLRETIEKLLSFEKALSKVYKYEAH